jgi:mitochondrial fission protein ELM1
LSVQPESTWIVTDGKAGMESQCLGLASALGLEVRLLQVKLRMPWRLFSPYLRIGLENAIASPLLTPPWPDLLIATGRQSVPASLYLRRVSPVTRRIQIQNPGIDPRNFDLVIAPSHDSLMGVNVVETIGALHGVTQARLFREAATLAPMIAALPRPHVGVLIGGANKTCRFGAAEATALAADLVRAAQIAGASLLVTPSRRTGAENIAILKKAFGNTPAFFWSGEGPNPYFGILGTADVLLVTGDSVNMVTEACASGRPVYIYDLPGKSRKLAKFHARLEAGAHARLYTGSLAAWPSNVLDEMPAAVEAVRRLM